MRLYSLLLLPLLLACEVRPVREELPQTKQEPVTKQESTPIKEPPIVAPKEEPRGLALAMRYTLPRSTGAFVIDMRRVLTGSVARAVSADMLKMLAFNPEWQQLQNATGLAPSRDVHGVVLSFRQATGKPTELVVAIVGGFDAQLAAGKATAASRHAEAAGEVLLLGDAALLTEAKAAKELEPFATSPALQGLILQVDPARPLYGAFLPPASASTSSIEKASQVMLELELDKFLYLKSTMLFSAPTEAEAAKAEIEKGVAQVGPMMSMFGISDPTKVTKAINVSTDANKLTLIVSIDEATATIMINTMIGLSKGAVPPPPPPPPPPSVITPG